MKKDPTEFRERFAAWKEGEQVYENGLPKYAGGKDPYEDTMSFLRKHEGFRDTTYLDGKGVPTIGYGFTDSALVKKGKISRAEADKRLRQEVINREAFLSKMKNWDKISDSSRTALRSYYYNYPAGFKDTTKFMKAWNSGDYAEAIRQVDAGMNDKANRGLRTRRLAEQALLKADPFLMPVKPKSQLVRQLEEAPVYEQPFTYKQPTTTDYSFTNKAGGILNAWNGADSPSYGGASLRMPTLEQYMRTNNILPTLGYKDGKESLPKYRSGTEGNFNMGQRRQITPREAAEVAQSTIHEQPVSNTDPIGEFVVKSVGATKAAGILGEILTAARLNRMAETYRNLRKYDQDVQQYTGKSLRKEHIQEADKIARDGFLYSRPENPLYWLMDPIMQGYSKLQSHPIIGPLIPF